jgi:hypothetical protein
MRKTAYLKAINEANQLPESIIELQAYFKDGYNPKRDAVEYILEKARLDVGALFNSEFVEIYSHAQSEAEK